MISHRSAWVQRTYQSGNEMLRSNIDYMFESNMDYMFTEDIVSQLKRWIPHNYTFKLETSSYRVGRYFSSTTTRTSNGVNLRKNVRDSV